MELLLPSPPSPAPPLAASPIKAHIRATSTAPPSRKTKKAHQIGWDSEHEIGILCMWDQTIPHTGAHTLCACILRIASVHHSLAHHHTTRSHIT